MTYTPVTKLACVERELKYRRRVYARMVETGKMSFAEAQQQIAIMKEIVEDYRKLASSAAPQLFDEGA